MLVARRSIGVVLIVALLGWTVNQPMWCQSQHSRAAVGVPAGASPAYKPEPSPSRHSCCPRKESAAVNPESPASATCFHHHRNASPDCCSVSQKGRPGLPPGVSARQLMASVALAPLLEFAAASQERSHLESFPSGPPARSSPNFTVLRL